MPEFLFYHLEFQPLTAVLPSLLEKTRAKGWRAFIRLSTEERLAAIDTLLWIYRADSFLPHSAKRDGNAHRQPIFLAVDADGPAPNGADVLFLIEDASDANIEGYRRVVRIFEGGDEAQVAQARAEWKTAKAKGFDVSYWKQDKGGGWKKSA